MKIFTAKTKRLHLRRKELTRRETVTERLTLLQNRLKTANAMLI
jgi:hypothetical protein